MTFTSSYSGHGGGSGCSICTLTVRSVSILWFPGILVSKSGRDPGILLLRVIVVVASLSVSSSIVTLALCMASFVRGAVLAGLVA